MEILGTADELSAVLGLVVAQLGDRVAEARKLQGGGVDLAGQVRCLQEGLFHFGGEVSAGKETVVTEVADPVRLEEWIDHYEAGLRPLRSFLFSGAHPISAQLHLGRTVCRRLERRVAAYANEGMEENGGLVPCGRWLPWLNRMADYLFVVARVVEHRLGVPERVWIPRESNGKSREEPGGRDELG